MSRRTRIDEVNRGYYTAWFIDGVYNSTIPTDRITKELLDTLSSLWSKYSVAIDAFIWTDYIDTKLINELGIKTIYLGGE